MRYIIALLAVFPTIFIKEAQKQFADKAKGYLLSDNSLPHITLAQFHSNNSNEVLHIWNELQTALVHISQPRFTGIGLSKKAKNLWGVSLAVARDPHLVMLHLMVIEVLKKYNIACVSDSLELYRPHLTLARIDKPRITDFNDRLLEPSPFILALGQGDEQGQYISTLFKVQ